MLREQTLLSIGFVLAACGHPQLADAPTFAADVAPIIYRSCTPCHRGGEPAPFSLLAYEDVWKRRSQIVEVTSQHIMPPWLPSHGDFAGDRRLRADEIELLRRWAEAGGPRGDAAVEPVPPEYPSGWQLREPHLIVQSTAILVPAAGPNTFRNFVIQLPGGSGGVRFVEAVEIRPDSRAVHHAVLAVDPTAESRRLDALDAEPGFPGMIAGNSKPPDGHFLGWTPGKRVWQNPPGMAWRLWPGHDLVLQLHITPTGKPETVRPRIGLYFTDTPTTAVSYPLTLFSQEIDLLPGVTDFVLRDHLVLPVPVTVHSIYPHAHYLCRSMRAVVTTPGSAERELFRIDAWDFDWQDDYRFREPLPLPAGTRIAFEYRYDNSEQNPQNPNRPPLRVRFGQESTDEMGTLTLQVTTATIDDRRRLAEASLRRDLDKVGYDAGLLLQLTGLLREMGRNDDAFAAVARVREREPGHAGAMSEYGCCLEVAGRIDEAERAFTTCLAADPSQNLARMQLAAILARSGRTVPAIEMFEQAVRLSPGLAPLHNNLATAYFASDRLELAAQHYRRALELDDRHFGACFNLGRVLAAMGQKDEARTMLLRARELRPGEAAVQQALQELDR